MTSQLPHLRFALLVCGALLGASAAQAQATRTWVSGVGDDVNPCSRTAPCKTFAGAISKTAANGEIDVLDPGGFGAVTITKSMTIDGTTGAGFGSILASGGINGVVINAAGATVRLRNLSINGSGGAGANGLNGIKITAAASVHIENVVIANFTNRGISDERTAAGKLFVTDTVVRNVAQSGVVLLAGGVVTAMLDRVISENNGNAGFSVSNGAKVTARNATSAGNLIGFYADTNATEFNLESCVSHGNATGATVNPPGTPTMRLSNCVITDNTANGLAIVAGAMQSFQNNKLAGNGGNQSGMSAASPGQQ
jgi:hypothetical protein